MQIRGPDRETPRFTVERSFRIPLVMDRFKPVEREQVPELLIQQPQRLRSLTLHDSPIRPSPTSST